MLKTTLATDTDHRLFLLGLSEQTRTLTDTAHIQFETCRVLANFLKVERAYYLEIDKETGTGQIYQDFFSENQTSLKGTVDIAGLSDLFLQTQEMGHHSIEDIDYCQNLSKTNRDFFNSIGIRSLLCTPVIKYGRMVGIMRVADSSPRQWNQETITVVKEVGERLWETVERAKIERRLQDRNTELENLTRQLRKLASDLTLAEQRARELLSKTLHDSLQQLLFSASLSLKMTAQCYANEPLLNQAQLEIKEAMELTRTLSLEIFPPALRMQGLPEALDWLGSWAAKKYKLNIEVDVDKRADPEKLDSKVLLFESVRELIFNVAKHARAKNVSLKLILDPNDNVKIIVSDDGTGFDTRELLGNRSTTAGIGILSIRERLTLMGGKFHIDSTPSTGTVITISTPLYSDDDSADIKDPDDEDSANGLVENRYPKQMSQMRLRILLADDHALVREGLRRLIESHNELDLVGEAADGREAIEKATLLRPDVIVMDVSMPVIDGVAATRRILRRFPDTLIFGISTYDDSALHPIKAAGAACYFSKRDGASELISKLLEEQKSRVAKIPSELSAGT